MDAPLPKTKNARFRLQADARISQLEAEVRALKESNEGIRRNQARMFETWSRLTARLEKMESRG